MGKLDDLNLWRVFVNLSQTRNFSYTAGELGVDVSTVSRMLTSLEKSLGRSLFVRTTRPLELTELGQRALELMREQLERQGAIVAELQGPNASMEGLIRLSTPYSLEMQFLGDALLRFQRKFPKVKFKVIGGGGMRDIESRRADIVFASNEVMEGEVVALPRRPNLFVPVASPAYIECHGAPKSPQELSKHTVFYFEGTTRLPTKSLVRGNQTVSLNLDNAIVMSNILAIKENVLQGAGICIDMPFFLCCEEIAQGRLVPILEGWHRPPVQTYVISSKDIWNSKIHRIFMQWVQKELQEFFDKKLKEIKPFWQIPEMSDRSAHP